MYIAHSAPWHAGHDRQTARLDQLKAVKDGHVYVIEDNLIASSRAAPGPGAQQLAKMIHPEAFAAQ